MAGDDVLAWVRRTRIDGDLWGNAEVPLGEEAEAYVVTVRQGGAVLRRVTVNAPGWAYTLADRLADGASGSLSIGVAQVSARFGPGPERLIALTV